MNSRAFFKFKTQLQKLALYSKEQIYLEDFTDLKIKDFSLVREPFPHIVIENFFKPDIYAALCQKFEIAKNKGFSEEKASPVNQFHAFTVEYDGYVYTPQGTLDPTNPLSLFFSLEWNNFFSKLFHQFSTFETTLAFHHHPIGNTTGFVHNDFVDMPFSPISKLPNGVIWKSSPKPDRKVRRTISILYYLNNPEWRQGDGGETGIYSADKKTLLKVVPPVNNTLFAFQTSPQSMHAFQGNKTERNSFVQWFHTPPELL